MENVEQDEARMLKGMIWRLPQELVMYVEPIFKNPKIYTGEKDLLADE